MKWTVSVTAFGVLGPLLVGCSTGTEEATQTGSLAVGEPMDASLDTPSDGAVDASKDAPGCPQGYSSDAACTGCCTGYGPPQEQCVLGWHDQLCGSGGTLCVDCTGLPRPADAENKVYSCQPVYNDAGKATGRACEFGYPALGF